MQMLASCFFMRSRNNPGRPIEINPVACPAELEELLTVRGTACLHPRGAHILYERSDDGGQGAFTPPVLLYVKRLPLSSCPEICIKRTAVTHFIGRAQREARLQVQLHHPHLLPALASLRGRRHFYLVLPAADCDLWAEAEALHQQGSGHTEEDLRTIAVQLLSAVQHLHESQLAHRDIKPANVLRMPDGRVILADFGCADGCMAGFVAAGTTAFLPPECRRPEGASMAVLPRGYDQRHQDMWGVGATLAALWLGRMPEGRPEQGGGGANAGAGGVTENGSSLPMGHGAGGRGATDSGDVGVDEGGLRLARRRSRGGGGREVGRRSSAGGVDGGSGERLFGSHHNKGLAAAAPAAEGGGDGAGAMETTSGALPPSPGGGLPSFLAAAGFGACTSAVGACGAAMSAEFQEFLAGLLRPRPAERLGARGALRHAWLAGCRAEPPGPERGSSTGVEGMGTEAGLRGRCVAEADAEHAEVVPALAHAAAGPPSEACRELHAAVPQGAPVVVRVPSRRRGACGRDGSGGGAPEGGHAASAPEPPPSPRACLPEVPAPGGVAPGREGLSWHHRSCPQVAAPLPQQPPQQQARGLDRGRVPAGSDGNKQMAAQQRREDQQQPRQWPRPIIQPQAQAKKRPSRITFKVFVAASGGST